MFFSKNSKYEMNKETANAALQNVFAACDKAPNTIPFDKLLLREKLNTHIYDRLVVLVLLLLLFTSCNRTRFGISGACFCPRESTDDRQLCGRRFSLYTAQG